jgi:hypothetical protein
LVVRQKAAIAERSVRQFHGQLVVMAISVLFILLTSTLSLKAVFALGWGALATVLCLMLVVRPLSVWLCTWRSDLNWRQKLFVAWLAPRGIVAASVASLFAILLTERGITGGDALKALVFLTISVTVTVQGLTAAWVARWLGLDQGSSTVIIGNHPLVGQLAQLLRSLNQAVEVLPLPSGSRLRERTANLPAELNGHKAGHTSGTHPASGNGSSKALPVRVSGTESSEEPGQVLPGSLQEAVLSESAFLKADIDHAETLLILTLDPQVNWAIAELMVKLSVSAAIWTVLLPEMPISEGIRTLPIPFSQLQRWASYLEANRAELRSITLPTLADLGLKPPPIRRGLGSGVDRGSGLSAAQPFFGPDGARGSHVGAAAGSVRLPHQSRSLPAFVAGASAASGRLVWGEGQVVPGRSAVLPAGAGHLATRRLHLLPGAHVQPRRGRCSLCQRVGSPRMGSTLSRATAPVC